MERVTHYRPRVSRETRLLVTTAVLAVLAMWMLARLRFPELPAEPRAISGILATLGTGADFDGLATQVARVRAVLAPYLLTVDFVGAPADNAAIVTRSALRIGGDLAVVLVPPNTRLRSSESIAQVAYDAASSLAVIRLPVDPATSALSPRATRLPQPPQYVIATAVYPDGVALRPVFVAAIAAVEVPLWSTTAWAVPAETGLTPGSFLFTRDGDLAGMTISHRGALAFVSGETVLDEANRLLARSSQEMSTYGVQVETLTPALERALGAASGVVVTWVDPNGPAGDSLLVGDVIDRADSQPIASVDQWRRHEAAAMVGRQTNFNVHRSGASRTLSVVLKPQGQSGANAAPTRRGFGAGMRTTRGIGTEVTSVDDASPAGRAGLRTGDVITFVGARSIPTPAQVSDVAGSLREGQSVLIGVRRGEEHRLLVLER